MRFMPWPIRVSLSVTRHNLCKPQLANTTRALPRSLPQYLRSEYIYTFQCPMPILTHLVWPTRPEHVSKDVVIFSCYYFVLSTVPITFTVSAYSAIW